MRTFIVRRVLHTIPLLLGVVTLTFFLVQQVPGDFILHTHGLDFTLTPERLAALRRRFGLDQPWWVQYVLYLKNVVLHFDFGVSFASHRPVFDVLREAMLNTLWLQGAAALFTWALAIPLGVVAAARHHSWVDRTLSVGGYVWLAIPEVFLGLALVAFAARTGLFPLTGMRSENWLALTAGAQALDLLHHVALPAFAIGIGSFAMAMRQMRANLLDVMRFEYVVTARAKGLAERTVLFKHALRNALHPMVTLFGLGIATLLSGSLVVEIIFGWPGLGRITYEALITQDQYLAMGGVLMVSTMLVLGNLVADVLLAVVDPRIAVE